MKLPKFITNEKLGISQLTFRRKENMLAVRYQDKKQIFLLSTMCNADIVNVRKRSHCDVQKSKVIRDYNQKMEGGGHKRCNDLTRNYSCIRKTNKWYKKTFYHFLEEALYNAFVVYSKEGQKKITKFMLFKSEAICEMLEFDCLKGHHFSSVITTSKSKEKPQKRENHKIRRESHYHCKNFQDHSELHPALCLMFHDTQIDFN